MLGSWVAGLRKRRRLEQQEVAQLAGVSIDQVSRLERGENVGMWYVGAVLSALNERHSLLGEEHGIVASLVADGHEVRRSMVLAQRLREGDAPPPKHAQRTVGEK